MKNYIIKYTVYDKNSVVLKTGKMKVKNRLSEFEAKCKFEEYLKKKYNNFNKLVIHDCSLDNPLGSLNDNMSNFNDLFGNLFGENNPFK